MDARAKGRRKKRKYGQGVLRHSRLGIQSCLYAAATIVIFGVLIGTAYSTRGMTAGITGGIGFLSVVLPLLGLRAGVRGLRERERKYSTCYIGVVLSIVELLLFVMIFARGVA